MARTVVVVPDRWSPRGEAACEPRGHKPLMVWQGIPGESARVRLTQSGQNQAQGEFLSATRPHKHRVKPPCAKVTHCGGCPLMHLSVEGQRDARHQLVRWALDDAGLRDVELGKWHASPDGLEDFRHVVKLGFGHSDHGRTRVGAWARHTRAIVAIPDCNVAIPSLRKAMMSLAHHTIRLDVAPYVEGRGLLRAAVFRASRTTGEMLLTLVATRRNRILEELAEEVARGVPELVGVWLHINGEPGNAMYSRDDRGAVKVRHLGGKEWIEERLDGIVYRIGPGDFFQTNPAVAEVLYRRTLERLDLKPDEAFVDLYSGVGGLALAAAAKTGFALGIEEVDGAVQRAREAARINRVPAEFLAGRVDQLEPELGQRIGGTGAVVAVDPARRGLEEGVIETLVSLEPSRIAYVSCNPRALARDLSVLVKLGWQVGSIDLFDMFPNTPHVECLAIVTPPAGAEPTRTRRAPRRTLVR